MRAMLAAYRPPEAAPTPTGNETAGKAETRAVSCVGVCLWRWRVDPAVCQSWHLEFCHASSHGTQPRLTHPSSALPRGTTGAAGGWASFMRSLSLHTLCFLHVSGAAGGWASFMRSMPFPEPNVSRPFDIESLGLLGNWQELGGNFVLRPPGEGWVGREREESGALPVGALVPPSSCEEA